MRPRFVPRIYKIPEIIEHGYIVFKVGGSTPSLSTESVILYDSKEGIGLDSGDGMNEESPARRLQL